jgi:cytoskeletal protein RodZ
MESLGEYLKKERELRGVTIDEISHITRISSRFLFSLEKDDYGSLPSDVFVKGFLRAYAKCVGLDPNEVISIYEKTKKTEDVIEVQEHERVKLKAQNSRPFLFFIVIAFIITAIGGVVYKKISSRPFPDKAQETEVLSNLKNTSESKTEELGQIENPTPQVINETQATTSQENLESKRFEGMKENPDTTGVRMKSIEITEVTGSTPKNESTPQDTQKPLTLLINASEPVWLKVIIDDLDIKEASLETGERLILKAKEKFSLTTGNNKGTDVTLDGEKISLPSTPSNVLRNYIISRR